VVPDNPSRVTGGPSIRPAGWLAAGEAARFLLVGAISNLLLFGVYLLLTGSGVGPKSAMTIGFAWGVLQSFVLNKRVSFRHRGDHNGSLVRFAVAYGVAYAINWAGLWLLVDRAALPHPPVQFALICAIGALLFGAQKLWVFRRMP